MEPINPQNELSAAPKRNIPRDLFLHLLAIVTLYWSSISFVTLLYQYINYFYPLQTYYYGGVTSFDKFSVASLIIVFPIFIATSWYLNSIYRKEFEVRESKIRKCKRPLNSWHLGCQRSRCSQTIYTIAETWGLMRSLTIKSLERCSEIWWPSKV